MATSARGLAASLAATFSNGAARVSATPPLELRGPFSDDDGRGLFLLRNVTAGVFSGDEYHVALRVEDRECVRVTGTSATKVYAMPSGHAESSLSIDVAGGGDLVYASPPLILQAGADFSQSTHINVEEGGRLIFSETVVLGRLSSGERCAFLRFGNQLSISGTDRDSYIERFTLLPQEASNDAGLGGYDVLGTILLIGARLDHDAVQKRLHELANCYAGISELPDGGTIVKVLAHRASTAAEAMMLIRDAIV